MLFTFLRLVYRCPHSRHDIYTFCPLVTRVWLVTRKGIIALINCNKRLVFLKKPKHYLVRILIFLYEGALKNTNNIYEKYWNSMRSCTESTGQELRSVLRIMYVIQGPLNSVLKYRPDLFPILLTMNRILPLFVLARRQQNVKHCKLFTTKY